MTTYRSKKCENCNCPNEGIDGKCPGNLGIGCFSDWRCCKDQKDVCKGCIDCVSDFMTSENCGRTDCVKIKEYLEKFN